MPAITPTNKRVIEHLVIVHYDYRALMRLTAALGEMRYDVTSAESPDVLQTALRLTKDEPASMILGLRGNENVVDVRELLCAASEYDVRLLFLVREPPPRAPLARVVRAHGAAILGEGEAPIVIASTLVAMTTREVQGPSPLSKS